MIRKLIFALALLPAPAMAAMIPGPNLGALVTQATVPAGAGASFTLVQSTGRQNTGTSTSFSSTQPAATTVGNFLVIAAADASGVATSTPTSKGLNFWSNSVKFTSGETIQIWFSSNAAADQWTKNNYSGAADNRAGGQAEVSGISQTSPTANVSGTFNAASVITSSMTISQQSVVICAFTDDTGVDQVWTAGPGFTALQSSTKGSVVHFFWEYIITSSDKACIASWDGGAGTTRVAGIAIR